jgi:acyl carrier protein
MHMVTRELKNVILTALKLSDWEIDGDTMAHDVPGWDSLSHVDVILAVEEHFSVRFNSREVLALKNIGDLQRLLDSKRQSNG